MSSKHLENEISNANRSSEDLNTHSEDLNSQNRYVSEDGTADSVTDSITVDPNKSKCNGSFDSEFKMIEDISSSDEE